MSLRWFMGLGIDRNLIVGRVGQLPAGESVKGGVKQESPWQAWGMASDWMDTDLGQHPSRGEAVGKVENWYQERLKERLRSKRMLVPCSVHSQYRKGCVSCEALNVQLG